MIPHGALSPELVLLLRVVIGCLAGRAALTSDINAGFTGFWRFMVATAVAVACFVPLVATLHLPPWQVRMLTRLRSLLSALYS